MVCAKNSNETLICRLQNNGEKAMTMTAAEYLTANKNQANELFNSHLVSLNTAQQEVVKKIKVAIEANDTTDVNNELNSAIFSNLNAVNGPDQAAIRQDLVMIALLKGDINKDIIETLLSHPKIQSVMTVQLFAGAMAVLNDLTRNYYEEDLPFTSQNMQALVEKCGNNPDINFGEIGADQASGVVRAAIWGGVDPKSIAAMMKNPTFQNAALTLDDFESLADEVVTMTKLTIQEYAGKPASWGSADAGSTVFDAIKSANLATNSLQFDIDSYIKYNDTGLVFSDLTEINLSFSNDTQTNGTAKVNDTLQPTAPVNQTHVQPTKQSTHSPEPVKAHKKCEVIVKSAIDKVKDSQLFSTFLDSVKGQGDLDTFREGLDKKLGKIKSDKICPSDKEFLKDAVIAFTYLAQPGKKHDTPIQCPKTIKICLAHHQDNTKGFGINIYPEKEDGWFGRVEVKHSTLKTKAYAPCPKVYIDQAGQHFGNTQIGIGDAAAYVISKYDLVKDFALESTASCQFE